MSIVCRLASRECQGNAHFHIQCVDGSICNVCEDFAALHGQMQNSSLNGSGARPCPFAGQMNRGQKGKGNLSQRTIWEKSGGQLELEHRGFGGNLSTQCSPPPPVVIVPALGVHDLQVLQNHALICNLGRHRTFYLIVEEMR